MKVDTIKSAVAVVASAGLIAFFLYLQKPAALVEAKPLSEGSSLHYNTVQLRHAEVRSELMDVIIAQRSDYIPVLVEQMGANESVVKRLLRQAVKHAPEGMQDSIQLDQTPETLRAGAAWGLLWLLRGHHNFARPVTPEETKILLPAIRNALKDESRLVRLNAVACLSPFDSGVREATDLCLAALKDKNSGVRYNAIYALWNIYLDEKKIVKLLAESLQPTEEALRAEALKNLKKVVAITLGTHDDPNDFE